MSSGPDIKHDFINIIPVDAMLSITQYHTDLTDT